MRFIMRSRAHYFQLIRGAQLQKGERLPRQPHLPSPKPPSTSTTTTALPPPSPSPPPPPRLLPPFLFPVYYRQRSHGRGKSEHFCTGTNARICASITKPVRSPDGSKRKKKRRERRRRRSVTKRARACADFAKWAFSRRADPSRSFVCFPPSDCLFRSWKDSCPFPPQPSTSSCQHVRACVHDFSRASFSLSARFGIPAAERCASPESLVPKFGRKTDAREELRRVK